MYFFEIPIISLGHNWYNSVNYILRSAKKIKSWSFSCYCGGSIYRKSTAYNIIYVPIHTIHLYLLDYYIITLLLDSGEW